MTKIGNFEMYVLRPLMLFPVISSVTLLKQPLLSLNVRSLMLRGLNIIVLQNKNKQTKHNGAMSAWTDLLNAVVHLWLCDIDIHKQ